MMFGSAKYRIYSLLGMTLAGEEKAEKKWKFEHVILSAADIPERLRMYLN